MARQEFRSPACEEHPSELLRCRHSQQSLGLRSHLDDVFCLLNTPKQRRHTLVIGLAFRSELERARRPLDELHAEATFQARDTFRDCGLGCPDKPAGSAEGARVDGADERDQARRLLKNRSHLRPSGTTVHHIALFHMLVTVFFFGFALLLGILNVMRGLYTFTAYQPPLRARIIQIPFTGTRPFVKMPD